MMWMNFFAKAFGAACNPNTDNANSGFFGFPHWWAYIKNGEIDAFGKCTPKVNFPNDIWAIGLAIVDMLLFAAGLVAVISIIIAGLEYMFTMGNSEKGVSARKRVVNSIIGLAIVLIAASLVSFIGKNVG